MAKAQTFSREDLLAESDALLGVRRHVLAGALATDKRKSSFSIDEARSLVRRYLSKPVESE